MRFLLIDRITTWEPGRAATATKNVSLSEDFFEDHFPEKPIMPGVLMLEGMAQLAGMLLEESARQASGLRVKALLSLVERAKFRSPVYPGEQIEYRVTLLARNEEGGKVGAVAWCQGEERAECTLVFSFQRFENERLERRQQQVMAVWMRGLRC
ncbi:MAG: 3-hydroxyacyl-ACP dehydratase FabZ [Armatimonadota bacterium]